MRPLSLSRSLRSESFSALTNTANIDFNFLHTSDSTTPTASPALLLSADTELVVAPKTRNSAAPLSSPKTHDLSTLPSIPNGTSFPTNGAPPTSAEWDATRRRLLRLLPRELLLDLEGRGDEAELETSAYVSSSLYKAVRRAWPSGKCSVGLCVRPKGEGATGGAGAGAGASGSGNGEKPKEDGALGAGSGAGGATKRVDVRFREARGVPAGHIWLGEKVRSELGLLEGSEGGFELLR